MFVIIIIIYESLKIQKKNQTKLIREQYLWSILWYSIITNQYTDTSRDHIIHYVYVICTIILLYYARAGGLYIAHVIIRFSNNIVYIFYMEKNNFN